MITITALILHYELQIEHALSITTNADLGRNPHRLNRRLDHVKLEALHPALTHRKRLEQVPTSSKVHARATERTRARQTQERLLSRCGESQTCGRGLRHLEQRIEQPARLHNDLEGDVVAVEWDVLGCFREVCGEVAGGADAGLLEKDAERPAILGVGKDTGSSHAECLIAESVGAVVAKVAAIGICFSFGLARSNVGGAKDVESFEEGGEGDLEGGHAFIFGVIVVVIRWIQGVIGKEGFAEACDA